MSELSFYSLESIQEYGVPVEIDDVKLTFTQAKRLANLVEKNLIGQAHHTFPVAVNLAVTAFRTMYERSDSDWKAKKTIELLRHGREMIRVRNKNYHKEKKERQMSRVKVDKTESRKIKGSGNFVGVLCEAGRRNAGKDRGRIDNALDSLFDLLNKSDQESVLRSLSKKLGGKVSFRRGEKK